VAHGKFQDIFLKKRYGQHFLTDQRVVDHMIDAVEINNASVLEIGPGGGFLTKSILQCPIARLWAFEIDPDWAEYITETYSCKELTVFHENFLDIDFSMFDEHKPWTVLANLPYQVTFPILHRFQQYRHLLKEGVIMVQEEVAQKIVKTKGRGYGFPSLFFQYFFDWKLMDKIPPTAFNPPPKVFSRLLYFKTKQNVPAIEHEAEFWKFIKICFKQPRRTLRNNLMQSHYDMSKLSDESLAQRAQQLDMNDLFVIWHDLNN
jgi:16S rRNA (adenine1518-N6/adenine1519-N6)-dimethyltransferase